jgi:hypothetical protein
MVSTYIEVLSNDRCAKHNSTAIAPMLVLTVLSCYYSNDVNYVGSTLALLHACIEKY